MRSVHFNIEFLRGLLSALENVGSSVGYTERSLADPTPSKSEISFFGCERKSIFNLGEKKVIKHNAKLLIL